MASDGAPSERTWRVVVQCELGTRASGRLFCFTCLDNVVAAFCFVPAVFDHFCHLLYNIMNYYSANYIPY